MPFSEIAASCRPPLKTFSVLFVHDLATFRRTNSDLAISPVFGNLKTRLELP